jgi:hypothetical protein
MNDADDIGGCDNEAADHRYRRRQIQPCVVVETCRGDEPIVAV